MVFKHLFGPVPSRRLGLSLGVDLVPAKVCPLDCVYCECGHTTNKTIQRDEYVPTQSVLAELEQCFSPKPKLDFVTFSGNGEPTLHKDFGKVVAFIKQRFPQYKLALLTNGVLFSDPQIRDEAMQCDLVIPSLDAVSDNVFRKINHPAPLLDINDIVDGLVTFRQDFPGKIWLEIFLAKGLNDSSEELDKLRGAAARIGPDKIQLNTLDRPGTEVTVQPVDEIRMREIARTFENAEIIAKYDNLPVALADPDRNLLSSIREILTRRPCTLKDLTQSLGAVELEVLACIDRIRADGNLAEESGPRGTFFRIKTVT